MSKVKVGVAGAGTMGAGIAQVAATKGHEVVLYDAFSSSLEKAQKSLTKILNRLVEKGRITSEEKDAIYSRIHFSEKLEDFAGSGLVIEAIVERIDIKKEFFSKTEEIVGKDCILASNTSSLSVALVASACQKPERVVGIHFFNPAPLMPLVEIIPAVQTSKETLDAAVNQIKEWGKVTVVAKDTPGFIVNRVARPFYSEAIRLYEEGFDDFATIDWAMKEIGGFRMGPFELMDFIGNDVNYTVTETVFASFFYDPRYKPSFTQKRLSEAGYLGRKSGRGYYNYAEGAEKLEPQKDQQLGEQIVWRVLVMLINEAADALYLNIASREDIDLAMTKGVNYPKGLLTWADEKGIENVLAELDALYNEYHEDRYRASVLLRKMVREGKRFY